MRYVPRRWVPPVTRLNEAVLDEDVHQVIGDGHEEQPTGVARRLMAKVKPVDERDAVAREFGQRAVLKPLVGAVAGGIPAATE